MQTNFGRSEAMASVPEVVELTESDIPGASLASSNTSDLLGEAVGGNLCIETIFLWHECCRIPRTHHQA